MSLGQRLRKAREDKGLKQHELAKLAGVSQQNIQKLENEASNKTAYILELADALDVDPYWLKNGKSKKQESVNSLIKTIPFLRDHEIEPWLLDSYQPQDLKWGLQLNLKEKAFLYEINGSPLISPFTADESIYPGDIAIIDPTYSVKNGLLVLTSFGKETYKIYKIDEHNNQKYLKSFDPNLPIIWVDDRIKIIGVIIGIFRINRHLQGYSS